MNYHIIMFIATNIFLLRMIVLHDPSRSSQILLWLIFSLIFSGVSSFKKENMKEYNPSRQGVYNWNLLKWTKKLKKNKENH